MPGLPRARTRVNESAGSLASGSEIICVLAPMPESADMQPRLWSDVGALIDKHGYAEGAEFVASHFEDTGMPAYFVALPIDVAGEIGRIDTSGNSNSSAVSVTGDPLTEHLGVVRVKAGGVVGTDQIHLEVSIDGGRTFKQVRVGTDTAYTLPYIGVELALGAGSLTAGETVLTWSATGPKSSLDDWTTARENLAAELQLFGDAILIGDLSTAEEAAALLTQFRAYDTDNDRYAPVRANVYDRLPLRSIGQHDIRVTSSHTGSLAFAAADDTITRTTGSWIAQGYAVGDVIEITGSADNDATHTIEALTDTVLTVVGSLVDETIASGVTIVSHVGLAFSNTGETVTRSRGSWLADGFRAGDVVTTDGTSGGTNDFTAASTDVTAAELTFGAGTVDADEVAAVDGDVTVSIGQSKADWMTEITNEFETVTDAPEINLAAGKRPCLNPITGSYLRRPPSWGAAWRSYSPTTDVHVTTWRKRDGIMPRFLADDREDWDDRVDGSAGVAASFTTFRSWANGTRGTYITVDCTRAAPGTLRVHHANARVVALARTIAQLETENVVGATLELNEDFTATEASLRTYADDPVNERLKNELLVDKKGLGKRASAASWSASRTDKYNQAENTMHGTLSLTLGGIVFNVETTVVIRK